MADIGIPYVLSSLNYRQSVKDLKASLRKLKKILKALDVEKVDLAAAERYFAEVSIIN